MSETVHLKIRSDSKASNADNLQYIQVEVEELGQREAWPDSLVFKEELGLNVLSYGGAGTDRRPELDIVLISDEDSLTIELSDDGLPFNPLEDANVPNVDALIEDRPIGGLGVHLVRTLMDDLSYEWSDGRNQLKMGTKKE